MSTQSYQSGSNSSTCVIELQEQYPRIQPAPSRKCPRSQSIRTITREEINENESCLDRLEILPSPTTAASERLQKWNSSRTNVNRTLACFWSFFVMGLNDAAYGALIPYLEEFYGLSYIIVSLVFLSPLVGYTFSALLNETVHLKLGQRGVAFIGPLCHLIAYVVIAVHPPYPVVVIIFMLAGFGNGIEDAAWNAWIGNMANANELLGFLHGFYSLGATVSPLIATTMITKAGLTWFTFYYVMIGAAALELLVCLWSFWAATALAFCQSNPRTNANKDSRLREALFTAPSARVTWLCAMFLFCYVGIEVALGGWIVTFMIRVRDAAPFASGMTATGFWLGMAIGRIILGFVTPRIGEKLAITIYIPITMAFELTFWLVPQFYVSAVAVALQGFFLGPMFPGAVIAATKLLPKHLHVSAIGFVAAFGGGGAAAFPFAVGAIAQAKGVKVLQPVVLALLAVIMIMWLGLPRISRKRE